MTAATRSDFELSGTSLGHGRPAAPRMIPTRRLNNIEPPTESVTSRLSLLRSLQRAGPRRRFVSTAPAPSSSLLRLVAGTAQAPEDTQSRPRTAGPPAPPSWSIAEEERPSQRRAKERRSLPTKDSQDKQKILAPLTRDEAPSKPTVQPLVELVGELICRDMSLPSESDFQPLVHLLPPHLRLRLIDIAAFSWPLHELGARELLFGGSEEASALDGSTVERLERNDEEDSDWEDEEGDPWDLSVGARPSGVGSFASLTHLSLAFSSIKLPALRQLLLHTTNTRSIPVFPHLSTLNLSATPSLHYSESFFDFLSLLLPLRHLALASKSLDHPSTVPQATFLPRLAAATPTLVSLDLSYASWPAQLIKGVDWNSKWLTLKTLGMRRELVDWKGEELGEVKLERIRRELWMMISAGRKRKRQWIDVVV